MPQRASATRHCAAQQQKPQQQYKMTILKGIPRIINPRLLYALARMGHGDELVGGAPSQCMSCGVHPCALGANAAVIIAAPTNALVALAA
jgi:hypothetical protein